MALYKYNPKLVIVTYGGLPLTGWADGAFLNVESNDDAFTLVIGTSGEGCRSVTNNASAKFTVTLGQWSPSNDYLMICHKVDVATMGANPVLPFIVTNMNNGEGVFSAHAWITKFPTQTYDREAGNREWVFETELFIPREGISVQVIP